MEIESIKLQQVFSHKKLTGILKSKDVTGDVIVYRDIPFEVHETRTNERVILTVIDKVDVLSPEIKKQIVQYLEESDVW